MTLVKICGLTAEEDVEMSRDADYNGFVVESGTRRSLDRIRAKELMSTSSRRTVAVTVSNDPRFITDLVNRIEPDVVQVHSVIGPEALCVLDPLPCELWALVPIGSGDERGRADDVLSIADAAVLDTYCEQGGGSGKIHDWELSADLRAVYPTKRIVLSGGLRADNVVEAIVKVHPDIVDVSSGVEMNGIKNASRIKDFIIKVRNVR